MTYRDFNVFAMSCYWLSESNFLYPSSSSLFFFLLFHWDKNQNQITWIVFTWQLQDKKRSAIVSFYNDYFQLWLSKPLFRRSMTYFKWYNVFFIDRSFLSEWSRRWLMSSSLLLWSNFSMTHRTGDQIVQPTQTLYIRTWVQSLYLILKIPLIKDQKFSTYWGCHFRAKCSLMKTWKSCEQRILPLWFSMDVPSRAVLGQIQLLTLWGGNDLICRPHFWGSCTSCCAHTHRGTGISYNNISRGTSDKCIVSWVSRRGYSMRTYFCLKNASWRLQDNKKERALSDDVYLQLERPPGWFSSPPKHHTRYVHTRV